MGKTTAAQLNAVTKYDKTHTKTYLIKLNTKTDAELIEYLNNCQNKQGTIKAALREYMKNRPE
jgi:hypothetical protein